MQIYLSVCRFILTVLFFWYFLCIWISESPTFYFSLIHMLSSLLADIIAALFCLLVISWRDSRGIPCSHHSLSTCSTKASSLCTNKRACHFHCLLLLLWVMFSSMLLAPFGSTLPNYAAFQSVSIISCPLYPFQIQPHDDSVFLFFYFSGFLWPRQQPRMFGNGHLD